MAKLDVVQREGVLTVTIRPATDSAKGGVNSDGTFVVGGGGTGQVASSPGVLQAFALLKGTFVVAGGQSATMQFDYAVTLKGNPFGTPVDCDSLSSAVAQFQVP